MKIIETPLTGVLLIEPHVYGDSRGFFMETWNRRRYRDLGLDRDFVQDNLSLSHQGTLRGLHFQWPNSQAKLVQVMRGNIFDVAVDIRRGSPAFGHWFGCELSATNHRQLYIPEGFAHGFCVLSEEALFAYKCTDFYNPSSEHCVLWSDPHLSIQWPVSDPLLSDKDSSAPPLAAIPLSHLPPYPS